MLNSLETPALPISLNDRMPLDRDRVALLGVAIDRVTREEAVERIAGFVKDGSSHQVVTVNLDFLRLARAHPDFRQVLNAADLAVADGMPLVWASGLAQQQLPERVTGLDLVEALCARGAIEGWSVFLLGAAPGVGVLAGEALFERHPGLRIAGTYSPPLGAFSEDEDAYIRDRILAARPDLLLVALGAPRQELWLQANLEALGVPVGIGVGCTFDVVSGAARRAPAWMQSAGLEWFFRLAHEPGRLAKRYLVDDLRTLVPLFLGAISAARARRRALASELNLVQPPLRQRSAR